MIQTRGTILSADNPIFLEDTKYSLLIIRLHPKRKNSRTFVRMNVNHLGTEDKPSLKNNSVMTEK